MGTISRSLDSEQDLTTFTVSGEVTAEQLIEEIVSFLTECPSQFVIWDLSAGALSKLSPEGLRMIVKKGKPYTYSRKGGRTAIVTGSDADFGLSRMFQIYAELEDFPFQILVSRSMREAHQWLTSVNAV